MLAVVVLLSSLLAFPQSIDYRAKAAFLVAFPNFIEWPEGSFASEKAPLQICIFGDFSFGTSLAEVARASAVHGRSLEVRWVHKEPDLRTCQMLFVSRSEAGHYPRILKSLQGASVLTVGETDDFLPSGGAIRFLVADDRLQFEVNIDAAAAAHLRISSTMLALAHHVMKSESAKVTVSATHADPQTN